MTESPDCQPIYTDRNIAALLQRGLSHKKAQCTAQNKCILQLTWLLIVVGNLSIKIIYLTGLLMTRVCSSALNIFVFDFIYLLIEQDKKNYSAAVRKGN